MDQGPERGVAEDREEVGKGLADADGPVPSELVGPCGCPVRRGSPAVDRHSAENDLPAEGMDALAELVIIRQMVDQAAKSADGFDVGFPDGYYRPEGERLFLQGTRLKDLTPEVRVDPDRLAAQGSGCRVGKPIEAVHEPDPGILKWRNDLAEEIGRGEDVGVADHEDRVLGERLEVGELGDLGVRACLLRTEHEAGFPFRMPGEDLADDLAGRVIGGMDGEEAFDGTWVILGEPAFQAGGEMWVGIPDRLQQGDRWAPWGDGGSTMEGEALGCDPLPCLNHGSDGRKASGGPIEQHVEIGTGAWMETRPGTA